MRVVIMMEKFFKKVNDQEKPIIENGEDFNPEVYDYLNAVVKLDVNGNIVSYNQVFVNQFGYTEQDLKHPFFDILLKDTSLPIRTYFENAVSGKSQIFNAVGFPKNGKPIDLKVTLIPIKNKSSKDVYVILKDITDFQKQEKELNQFQKMQEAFFEIDYICSFYYDAINDFHYFSKQITDMLKINPEKTFTPSLNHLLRYVHPDDVERLKNTIQTALNEKIGFQIEYRLIRKDQTICLVREQAGILLDKEGNLDGVVGFIQDITDHKISSEVLEKEKQIKILYDNPDVGFWSFDVQTGKYLNTSNGIKYITGYTKEDLNNDLHWTSIIHNEDLQQYLDNRLKLEKGNIIHHQYRIINKNGDIRWIQDYTIPQLDHHGEIVRLYGLTSDITEQKALEEKIRYMANYDFLTKLPNRNKFIENLEQLIDRFANTNNRFAVMKLDIDGFKHVNDTLGNEAGDELLKLFSNRIKKHLTSKDMLARQSGDKFMMLIENLESLEALKTLINKIIDCINEPFNLNGYQLYVTASIGISTYPENGSTSLELRRNANLALQQSKKRGKNNYHILSHSSSIQSFKNYSIARDLKKAVENKEMTLYFQPRVDANSNEMISAEALIRWNHPEWGLISPFEFLTIAEENGLITEIDDWVLNEVCRQIRNWKNRGMHVVPVSINISAIHFMIPDWPSKVAAIIQDAGIHSHDIEFEITESTILNNSEVVKSSISKLKELGIKLSLDDFGTGYSSLSYLTQYPFDVIKIDKSFIRNMHENNRDLHLTKSIIYMARGLDLRVVAEGVETIQQLKILQQEQCHEIQGYLFSHPVPLNEFEVLLQKRILPPMDSERKAKQSKRKHYRLNFPYALEADMELLSIADRSMELGVSKVLIEDMSIGGLRFVSNLKLPTRSDAIYQFQSEIIGESITLKGSIVWKEEINEDLMEYGIKFSISEEEQASLSTLLDSFITLLNTTTSLPPYRKVSVAKSQYFK